MRSINIKIGEQILSCTKFDEAADGTLLHEYYAPTEQVDALHVSVAGNSYSTCDIIVELVTEI